EAKVRYEGLPLLRERQDRLRREGTQKKSDLETMKGRLAELQAYPGELDRIEERLVTLDDPRGRSRSLLAGLEKESSIRAVIATMEESARGFASKMEELSSRLNSFSDLDDRITGERARRVASEPAYLAYIENLPLSSLLEERESEFGRLESGLAEGGHLLEGLEAELEECRTRYDADRHRGARAGLEELINRTAMIASELGHATARVDELTATIDRLQEAKSRLDGLRRDRERCDQLLSLSDFIRDVLKKAAPFITEALLQSISMEANQLYRDITGNPMVSLRWDSSYDIVLEEDGHERSFASLSGGEQMAAALSVRLALLKELSEMRIAFFDEPTTNMDEDRRRNLAQQIGRIKDFDQLFVISHDDAFEGFTDQVVSVRGPAAGV
ncbi:MAG TPA: hypothetical protein VLD57_12645, partial [Blastocatellia bacterium]|nr:hypothetical protein [Blastocatellia bacterium]